MKLILALLILTACSSYEVTASKNLDAQPNVETINQAQR